MTVGKLVGAAAFVFLVAVLSAGAAYVLGGLWLAWWLLIDLGRAEQ